MAVRNNPFKPFTKSIPAPFKNKYFVITTIFVAWMVFFDKHDILTQWQLQQTLNKMEEDREYYKTKIREAHEDQVDIRNNKEKFAREKYYLQKSNEDVFIMIDPDSQEAD
jgi:cell division protein DivIC